MRITYSDEVFEEFANLSFYLSDRSEELAQIFLDSCDETFQLLANNKFIGSKRDFKNKKLSEVRMWRVKNFEKIPDFLYSNKRRNQNFARLS